MKKNKIGSMVAIGIGILFATILFSSDSDVRNEEVFHITLADPDLYENGIFSDTFEIQEGNYQFRFTPNGDSPKTLSIALEGKSISFSEDFELEGTLHDTGISSYYTWDYLGSNEIQIDDNQQVRLKIDPHNNLLGPVSLHHMAHDYHLCSAEPR